MDQEQKEFFVTTVLGYVLSITAWNMLRVYSTWLQWQVLEEFGANGFYVGATGVFWALAGFFFGWAFLTRQHQALPVFWALPWLYAAWYWLDTWLVQVAPAQNYGYALVITILALLFYNLSLAMLKPLFDEWKEDK